MIKQITLPTYIRNDTWPGLKFTINWTSADRPGLAVSARMFFRARREPHILGDSLTSAASQITITDTTDWDITVAKKVLSIDFGYWNWDLEVTDANSDVYTIAVGTLLCQKDVTFVDP